jgi:uncharacterized protein YaaQ
MKLIVAIVHDHDTDPLLRALTAAGYRATRIASSGGYLRRGNGTVFLGVEDAQVRECMQLVKRVCGQRVQQVPIALALEGGDAGIGAVAAERIGGGVVFVANVERFVRIGIDDLAAGAGE